MNAKISNLTARYHLGILSDAEAAELSAWVASSPSAANSFKQEIARLESESQPDCDASDFWSGIEQSEPTVTTSGRLQRLSLRAQVAVTACLCVAVAVAAVFITRTLSPAAQPLASESLVAAVLPAGDADVSCYEDAVAATPKLSEVYEAPAGTILPVTLPDGTLVTLNKGSKLTVSPSFGEKMRSVKLNGEAFFDVAKDPEHPFCVNCQGEKYIVRGTSFNVMSYASDNYSMVTLHTGSLEALVKEDRLLLSPGDQLCVDQADDNISRRKVDVSKSVSWMTDESLNFNSLPLKYVCSQMSHKYGVKISVHDSVANILYDGNIDDEPLDIALRLLAITAPVKLQIVNIGDEYYLTK